MFSPAKFGFPAPMFVTMMHMFVQWGLSGVLRTVRPDLFKSARSPERADYMCVFPRPTTFMLDCVLITHSGYVDRELLRPESLLLSILVYQI